jgi:hypothetical protein
MGGNRFSSRAGAFSGTVLIAAVAYGTAAHAAAAPPDLSGTYWATEYHAKIQVAGGGEPPLNAAGKTAYQMNQAGLKDGSIPDPARSVCLPDGVPRVLATPYPFELFQAPVGQVTFVHELNHQIRPIPLNGKLPSYEDSVLYPTYGGRSIAHYEGDTLVIESNSFNDQTFLDATGLPHSDKLVTTERVRKIGNQLEDVVTIHDPELYTRDWQARFVYAQRDDIRLQDYSCGDKHRDISSVKGVNEARAARAQGR